MRYHGVNSKHFMDMHFHGMAFGIMVHKCPLDEVWTQTPGAAYRWIRGDGDAPFEMVGQQDGSFAANVDKMDAAITAAW